MATPITMPRLGLSMVEGTVTEWRVDVGAHVERGQTILVVESEKAEVEIEAFASGNVAAVYVPVGQTVTIGALLGAITDPGETFDAEGFAAAFVPETEGAPATAAPARTEASPTSTAGPTRAEPASGEIKAAPAARALAKKLGVDLGSVRGTGPGGRILPDDVERAAAAPDAGDVLAGEVVGTGPALVLVSGFGVDRSGWRRQIEGLSERFAVGAFDHRGIGTSPPLRAGTTIASLANDLAGTIRARSLSGATVVGASLGAAVAVELALRHPDAAAKIVCLAPALLPDSRFEAVLRTWAATEVPADEARIQGMLPWLLGRSFLENPGKRGAAATALRTMAKQTPPATLAAHAEALLGWLGTRANDLSKIQVPALVLVGEDDCLTPPDQARALAAALPSARLELVLGAGHALMVERPESVNAAIASFAG